MQRSIVRKSFVLAPLLLAMFAAHANAQDFLKGNVYGGYSFLSAPGNPPFTSRATFNGWDGSVEFKLAPGIGAVADFGGNYGTVPIATSCPASLGECGPVEVNTKLYTYVFGPRFSAPIGRFRPFAHVLFGGAHSSGSGDGFTSSNSSYAVALGGGLDYKLIKGIAWRAQFDDMVTKAISNSQNNLRFTTGVVFRF
ncbi:MAG: outer membrane beta-barrel protein [Candidatus Sulfotelmatobacter sp.]